MRIIPVESINSRVGDPKGFIEFSEEEYRCGVVDTALGIIKRKKPIVLITGPSGSGKTLTAHLLESELIKLGAKTRIISMDNYFISLKNGIDGIDLESPDRLDRALFREQSDKILLGQEVILPVFNFTNQERTDGEAFARERDEIVIFEGIHALNPEVTGNLSENAGAVYVSVRTRIKGNNTLHPSKIRLMRRFVRDKLFRGRTLLQTMEFYANVERGEKLYIMPHKKNAQFDIDTFIAYEPCVYKKHILAELYAANGKHPIASELIAFLEELEEIGDEFVPSCSLVREFIGGSSLMAH